MKRGLFGLGFKETLMCKEKQVNKDNANSRARARRPPTATASDDLERAAITRTWANGDCARVTRDGERSSDPPRRRGYSFWSAQWTSDFVLGADYLVGLKSKIYMVVSLSFFACYAFYRNSWLWNLRGILSICIGCHCLLFYLNMFH